MPFQPGQSGNPKGRPRVGDSLADAIRRRFPPERIVDMLESLSQSDDDRVRATVTQVIADRGYGKVKEHLEVESGMTPEQVALFEALRMTPHERRLAAQNSTADAIEDAKAAADADDA